MQGWGSGNDPRTRERGVGEWECGLILGATLSDRSLRIWLSGILEKYRPSLTRGVAHDPMDAPDSSVLKCPQVAGFDLPGENDEE